MSDSHAHNAQLESEIQALEQREAEAELHGDLTALSTLWSDSLLANSTSNLIAGKQVLFDLIRSGRLRIKKMERRTLRMTILDDLVVTTGNETSELETGGGLLFCSYMNVWARHGGTWQMLARHVGLISRAAES
ncbi:MAG: hypothetical protein JWM69_53 [Candidatus Binatus sp.]|nr:hypothetical protein [Candidatus Binatus sp.]